MANRKKYTEPSFYENKLDRVMERLGPGKEYNFNFDRHGAWVEFRYRGELFRFDHTVEKARAAGQDIHYGSDCFAQIVLALEDLTRIVSRGIYDFGTWVAGMRYLPLPEDIPACFVKLGFTEVPSNIEDVRARYKNMIKQCHPDNGGDADSFERIRTLGEDALRIMKERGGE